MSTTVQSTVTNPFAAINASASSSTSSTSSTEDQQQTFLNLLVTQLKNQDPLNPMDNAQMTSQLAQMNTATGIAQLNTTLNSLVSDIATSQSMQAASLIGKNVLVPGKNLTLSSGTAYAGINLASAADQVTVNIYDSKGALVSTENLGAQSAGVLDVAWDGTTSSGSKAADGNYTFTVSAVQGGNSVTVSPLQVGTVSALVRSGTDFQLDLGTLGRVNYSDVQQVL